MTRPYVSKHSYGGHDSSICILTALEEQPARNELGKALVTECVSGVCVCACWMAAMATAMGLCYTSLFET